MQFRYNFNYAPPEATGKDSSMSWKTKAFLSQFILPEDSSYLNSAVRDTYASAKSASSSSSSYDSSRLENASRLYLIHPDEFLCDCDSENRSFVRLILRWARIVLRKVGNVYLSNPFLLTLLPLFCGLLIGFLVARYYYHRLEDKTKCSSTDFSYTCNNDDTKHSGSDESRSILTSLRGVAQAVSNKSKQLLNQLPQCASSPSLDNSSASKSLLSSEKVSTCIINTAKDDFTLIQDEEREAKIRADLATSLPSMRDLHDIVPVDQLPRHIAVIMDGNRRYGRAKYKSATQGHWDGSKTLVEFCKWCRTEGIFILTVYAFSTENWDRDPREISALMNIFLKYCEELKMQAVEHGICLRVLSTDTSRIPENISTSLKSMVEETKDNTNFTLNICLSYGSRGEIVNACKSIAADVLSGEVTVNDITEKLMSSRLLTGASSSQDPDLVIRTSGEMRLSNFLLWQLAYSEMFFLKKRWPELCKDDLLDVIKSFAKGRVRRFGK